MLDGRSSTRPREVRAAASRDPGGPRQRLATGAGRARGTTNGAAPVRPPDQRTAPAGSVVYRTVHRAPNVPSPRWRMVPEKPLRICAVAAGLSRKGRTNAVSHRVAVPVEQVESLRESAFVDSCHHDV